MSTTLNQTQDTGYGNSQPLTGTQSQYFDTQGYGITSSSQHLVEEQLNDNFGSQHVLAESTQTTLASSLSSHKIDYLTSQSCGPQVLAEATQQPTSESSQDIGYTQNTVGRDETPEVLAESTLRDSIASQTSDDERTNTQHSDERTNSQDSDDERTISQASDDERTNSQASIGVFDETVNSQQFRHEDGENSTNGEDDGRTISQKSLNYISNGEEESLSSDGFEMGELYDEREMRIMQRRLSKRQNRLKNNSDMSRRDKHTNTEAVEGKNVGSSKSCKSQSESVSVNSKPEVTNTKQRFGLNVDPMPDLTNSSQAELSRENERFPTDSDAPKQVDHLVSWEASDKVKLTQNSHSEMSKKEEPGHFVRSKVYNAFNSSPSLQSMSSVKPDPSHSLQSMSSVKQAPSHSLQSMSSVKPDPSHSLQSMSPLKADPSHSLQSMSSVKQDPFQSLQSMSSVKQAPSHSLQSMSSVKQAPSHSLQSMSSVKPDPSHSLQPISSVKQQPTHISLQSNTSSNLLNRTRALSVGNDIASTDSDDAESIDLLNDGDNEKLHVPLVVNPKSPSYSSDSTDSLTQPRRTLLTKRKCALFEKRVAYKSDPKKRKRSRRIHESEDSSRETSDSDRTGDERETTHNYTWKNEAKKKKPEKPLLLQQEDDGMGHTNGNNEIEKNYGIHHPKFQNHRRKEPKFEWKAAPLTRTKRIQNKAKPESDGWIRVGSKQKQSIKKEKPEHTGRIPFIPKPRYGIKSTTSYCRKKQSRRLFAAYDSSSDEDLHRDLRTESRSTTLDKKSCSKALPSKRHRDRNESKKMLVDAKGPSSTRDSGEQHRAQEPSMSSDNDAVTESSNDELKEADQSADEDSDSDDLIPEYAPGNKRTRSGRTSKQTNFYNPISYIKTPNTKPQQPTNHSGRREKIHRNRYTPTKQSLRSVKQSPTSQQKTIRDYFNHPKASTTKQSHEVIVVIE